MIPLSSRSRRLASILAAALLSAGCAGGRDLGQAEAPSEGAEQEAAGPTWESNAPVPTPRTEVTAAPRRGRILVVGGFVQGMGTVGTVEIYDTATGAWSPGPDLPVRVNHPQSATLDGVVYVMGGYRGPGLDNQTRRAFAYSGGGWRAIAPMPGPRAAGGAAAVDGRIYVVGGVARDGLARRTFVYNPRTNSWATRPGLRTPRQHLGVAGYHGKVYALAGRIGGLRTNLDAAERYDPKTRVWSRLPDVPTARGGLAAAATSAGLIVAVGGEAPAGTFEEVEAFVVGERRWRRLPDLPTPRHGLGVVYAAGAIYTVAGGPQPGGTFSDANESLSLK